MKRTLSVVSGFILIVALISCGGYLSIDTSLVTITIGEDQTASISAEKTTALAKLLLLLDKVQIPAALALIPDQVETVTITVEADDMETIIRSENVSGQSSVSITIEVPNGMSRHFTVKSMDNSGYLIYMGDSNDIDLNGEPVSLSIDMIYIEDSTLPNFAGLASATGNSSPSRIDLSWTAATDDVSASTDIVYLIYMSTTSGGQDFTTPDYITSPGVTTYSIRGQNPSIRFYFVVRAMDEVGNVDTNTTEMSATRQSDTQSPVFGGLGSATAVSTTSIGLAWTAATDDVTVSSNIDYLIYVSLSSGGQNFTTPDYITSPGVTTYAVTGLSASTTYYFVVRARDEAGNVDTNTTEMSAITPNTQPPAFGGLALANSVSNSQIDLSWTAATDDVSAPADIVYLVYMSTTSGGQNFTTANFTTAPGATTYSVYYFVVRAMDEAGNIDANTIEQSDTTSFM